MEHMIKIYNTELLTKASATVGRFGKIWNSNTCNIPSKTTVKVYKILVKSVFIKE